MTARMDIARAIATELGENFDRLPAGPHFDPGFTQDDFLRAADAAIGLSPAGWRRDYENAPSEPHQFFLVRPVYPHPGTGEVCLPSIVQQIGGELFSPTNEIEPLIFGRDEPWTRWREAGLEWRPLPADWLAPSPAPQAVPA